MGVAEMAEIDRCLSMRLIWALALASLFLVPLAQAGESRFELTDGSVLTGELRAVESGRYWIRSMTLGDLSVPEDRVRSVTPLAAASAPVPGDSAADLSAIQERIGRDPSLMQQVMALQQDPDLRAILSDRELTAQVVAGDLEQLKQDPRIRRLLDKPEIRALVGELLGH